MTNNKDSKLEQQQNVAKKLKKRKAELFAIEKMEKIVQVENDMKKAEKKFLKKKLKCKSKKGPNEECLDSQTEMTIIDPSRVLKPSLITKIESLKKTSNTSESSHIIQKAEKDQNYNRPYTSYSNEINSENFFFENKIERVPEVVTELQRNPATFSFSDIVTTKPINVDSLNSTDYNNENTIQTAYTGQLNEGYTSNLVDLDKKEIGRKKVIEAESTEKLKEHEMLKAEVKTSLEREFKKELESNVRLNERIEELVRQEISKHLNVTQVNPTEIKKESMNSFDDDLLFKKQNLREEKNEKEIEDHVEEAYLDYELNSEKVTNSINLNDKEQTKSEDNLAKSEEAEEEISETETFDYTPNLTQCKNFIQFIEENIEYHRGSRISKSDIFCAYDKRLLKITRNGSAWKFFSLILSSHVLFDDFFLSNTARVKHYSIRTKSVSSSGLTNLRLKKK